MDKAELIQRLNDTHRHILELIQHFEKADFERPGPMGEWTAKDMFAHLAYWNWEAKQAIELAIQNERPAPWLDVGRSEIEAANQREGAQRRALDLYKVMDDFRRSHKSLAALLERTPEADLLKDVPYQDRGGKTANAAWVMRGLLGHYEEHTHELQAWLDKQAQQSK